jgi:hypothetical protein
MKVVSGNVPAKKQKKSDGQEYPPHTAWSAD